MISKNKIVIPNVNNTFQNTNQKEVKIAYSKLKYQYFNVVIKNCVIFKMQIFQCHRCSLFFTIPQETRTANHLLNVLPSFEY